MRLKLFNGAVVTHNLTVLSGGYDPDTSRVVLIVRGDNDAAGTLLLDVAEAHRVAAQITKDTPQVTRVEHSPRLAPVAEAKKEAT